MSDVEKDFAVHEAVCAERYRGISDRLDKGTERMHRIEILLYLTIAAVLLGPGVAAEFVKKLVGL
jgi:predicted nucleic acid-binding Zn ribbon protein